MSSKQEVSDFFVSNLPQLQSAPVWSTRKTLVTCINVIQETPDVKTFQFQAVEPILFHFKPGQFVGMQLEVDGVKHNRSYTVASTPSRPHLLELTIKKELGGSVSPWIHENITIGSNIELRGPAGKFNCFDIALSKESEATYKKVLLISAGSGITPMMSMARFWTDTSPGVNIRFLNWVRSVEDIIFRRELSLLDHKNDNFQLEVICTQPGLSENWLGRRGRVNQTTLNDMVEDLRERIVFCCGPDGFMQRVKTSLKKLGFNMENYHDETFDPGGKKKSKLMQQRNNPESVEKKTTKQETNSVGPYNVKLNISKKVIIIEENELLLEKLEASGVEIDSGCRVGNCGACQVKKIEGITTTQNEAGLQNEERELGLILTCTTQVQSDLELHI